MENEKISKWLTVTRQDEWHQERFNSITYANLMKWSKAEAERYLARFNKPKENVEEPVKWMIPDAIKPPVDDEISDKNDWNVIPNWVTNNEVNTEITSNINIQQDEKQDDLETQLTDEDLKWVTITIEDRKALRKLYEQTTWEKPANNLSDKSLIDVINKAQK